MRRYVLEGTVCAGGAALMTLELAGSRVLAPYVGTSIVVWTALIGIILGSLSFGSWWGGKIADRGARPQTLSMILFLAALSIGVLAFGKEAVLTSLTARAGDIRTVAVVGAVLLFAAPSALLGMVTPYAVRLTLTDLSTSGGTVGNLYALSTIGSILGTFGTGFFLLARFGNTAILFGLACMLLFLSLLLERSRVRGARIVTALFLVLSLFGGHASREEREKRGFVDADTPYNRVWVYETADPATGRPIRLMTIGGLPNSGVFLASDELVFDYTKFYRLAAHFAPLARKALMIGGGGYAYPRDFLARFPEAAMDVAEIDPGVTALAERYFRLRGDPRLAIHHEDARTFLRGRENAYDVIFGDAFQSFYSVPYHLTTREAAEAMRRALTERGVVIMNLVSAIEGSGGKFLRAEYATFREVFPWVFVFPVTDAKDGGLVQNVMLLALASPVPPALQSDDPEIQAYLSHVWDAAIPLDVPVLTDDFAPVEHYVLESVGHRLPPAF